MIIFGKPKDTKTLKYFALLTQWLNSPQRKEMLLAKDYYDGKQDILNRERTVINESGQLSPVNNLPNNKLVDNQYSRLVDQKTNFALGKPITIATSDESYLEELTKLFNRKFARQIRLLGEEAISSGIAYLYPYYNESGEFKLKVFPGYEIMPIWSDSNHTDLVEAVRYYADNLLDGGKLRPVNVVEIYSREGIDRYIMETAGLVQHPFEPHIDYLVMEDQTFNWERLPIIPFKYNAKEIPLIRRVKGLQDALNQVLSDFQNNMEEDPRNTILVLKNYDGTDLASFRRNLATYGTVKVTTVDGVQGGLETLNVEVKAENYKAILMQLKRAIVENGRGFDAKEERMDGDPNQMNIESMYTDIDLDVDQMETEFQYGFDELKWFVDQHFINMGLGDFTEEKIEFIFNRDIFINENAMIDNCVKSVGIISNKTILSRHPWVADVQRELDQLEEDKQQEMDEMEQMAAFESQKKSGGDSDGDRKGGVNNG